MANAILIHSVKTLLIDVPTIRPHRLSMTTMNSQTLVIVRVFCSDDITGHGEATTIGGLSYGEESPESIRTNIEAYIAPLLVGRDATRIGATMQALHKAVQGNRFAKCAVETALLDAQGIRLGLPISELLGGRLRNRLPVAWTLASGDTDTDIAEAERMLSLRRHNVFKLKIGARDLRADIAHVSAIARALHGRASVRVDVNQAWTETDAVRGIAALAAAGCELVEQPVDGDNFAAMARLSARSPLPIMADESIKGPQDGFNLASIAAAQVFAVKIAQNSGPAGAARLAAIADAAGIGLYGGTMLEGGIGTAASAQLFATFPNLAFGTELFGPLLLLEELLVEPLDYGDFSLRLPDGPGLGVALDPDKLAFFDRDQPARRVHVVHQPEIA